MTIITDELVERCARAAYEETAGGDPHREQWEALADWWRRQYRRQARAVLTEALQPAPVIAGVFHIEGETVSRLDKPVQIALDFGDASWDAS